MPRACDADARGTVDRGSCGSSRGRYGSPVTTNTGDAASITFGQVPAARVIAECLRVQAGVPPRGALARFFGRSPLSDDSRSWYLGALGEKQVAQRLAALGPEWTVLHSVPIGTRGSDIDHLLVSARGVFTINTKFHENANVWVGARRLLVNGQKTDHLRNSRFEAQRTGHLLREVSGVDAAAQAVLVIVRAKSITVKERPSEVVVLRDTELVRWLRKRPGALDADAACLVANAARSPVTWSSAPAGHPVDVAQFAALKRIVQRARVVRLAWLSGLVVAMLAVGAPSVLRLFG